MAVAAQPDWRTLARSAAGSSGLPKRPSETILQVLEDGFRYSVIDAEAREVVLDVRALFLGFVIAGRRRRRADADGNTATWFSDWLAREIGDGAVADGLSAAPLTDADQIGAALAEGCRPVTSRSVRGLIDQARKLAAATGRPPHAEARHLFAAMILDGTVTNQASRLFGVGLIPRIPALKARLILRIMANPLRGETTELWCAALGVSPDALDALDTPPGATSPAEGVTGFSRDTIASAGDDPLSTQADADALARLICLADAAPLAVAVFGDWGSGKSTFMNRVDAAIRALTDDETAPNPPEPEPGAPSARFVRRVVQIRFNAWQFVDANLWASLTSEFFDQLRAGGWDRAGDARHSGLVERVNRHVHSLNAEVEARREAAAEGGKAVLVAQKARDEAAHRARSAAGASLGQAAIDALGDLYEAQKQNLSALGMSVAGVDTARAIDTMIDVAARAGTIGGQARSVWSVLSRSKTRLALATCGLSVAGVAVAALVWSALTAPGDVLRWLTAALTTLGALAGAAAAAAPALRFVGGVAARSAHIAKEVDNADHAALNTLLSKELALREAAVEAEALQAAAQRASQRLARYVSPDGTPNPPRLLRYVLEDDPDTQALTREIGLIGRTRRLFQAVDDIIRSDHGRDDCEVPDRIVLYIDDLDRCTDEQVYNVLQAIHLLLAFEAFVVVVGVDVKRVRTALAHALAPREADDLDKEALAALAAAYLEKIFQVAFWLAPLSAHEVDGDSFGRYVRQIAGPIQAFGSPAGDAEPEPAPVDAQRPAVSAEDVETPGSEEAANGAPEPPARRRQRKALATIQLSADEVAFLASPAIAAIAPATPRGVKRLVNVYRLARSRLTSDGLSILGGGETPAAYPLIAFIVAVETGQPVEVANDLFEGLKALGDAEQVHPSSLSLDLAVDSGALTGLPRAVEASPSLLGALAATNAARNNDVSAGDLLRVARVVRRYSFNADT